MRSKKRGRGDRESGGWGEKTVRSEKELRREKVKGVIARPKGAWQSRLRVI
ncbi:MAG: hypothetical protein KAW19_06305 [Candidatus Aminicenantes bacterium]|nr:hypothetical protein [Candidatus Aminicenantes bacterium]